MTSKVTIDRAGRVVIPKPLRDHLRLTSGTALELESEGQTITLRPVHSRAVLRKEHGIWVFQGERTDTSIPELIEKVRQSRLKESSE